MRGARAVVVGAGLAGLRATEGLRRSGFAGEVLVLGGEPHPPYNRPPLSKTALSGGFDPTQLHFRVSKEAASATWRLGESATSLDLAAASVATSSGEHLEFDGLVIATGVRAARLAIPGPRHGVFRIRDIGDIEQLRRALEHALDVVVIGAGFVGCEVAATLVGTGRRVSVVTQEEAPLDDAVGRSLGEEIRHRHARAGVNWILGDRPTHYEGEESVSAVALRHGGRVAADLVIEAVGSRPNVEWLEGTPIDTSNGVATDSSLRVLDQHGERCRGIVAAGDVARIAGHPWGLGARRIEHWTVAHDTGKLAGSVLARELDPASSEDFAGAGPVPLPSFWSDQYGVRIQSFGYPGAGVADARLLEGDLCDEACIGYYRDDELVGVVLIGLPSRHRHYRDLLASRQQVMAS